MWIRTVIEIVFILGLFINATLFIPQIIKLYKTKKSEDVSLLTFAGFNFIQLFVILHGYLHKDYLLMIGYILSFLMCGTVTWMVVLYRK